MVTVKLLSSLDKVFVEGPVEGEDLEKGQALIGEKFGFQIAFKGSYAYGVSIDSPSLPTITVYEIGQIPSQVPTREGHDEVILKGVPGFYPDALYPVDLSVEVRGTDREWHSFWVEVNLTDKQLAGTHQIDIEVEPFGVSETIQSEKLRRTFTLDVLPLSLPVQTLIHTEWFHTDGIITYYGVEVFSEAYWQWVEKYLRIAVEHGVNMILTPLVTPPLDTEIGGERPTVQLVGITKTGADYQFDFSQLNRWSTLCRKVGIVYLEMAHLYTQWGAKATPKIMVTIEGREEAIFGWQTDSASSEYRHFLGQFVPAVLEWLAENKWLEKTYFHVSDEPTMDTIDSYRQASQYLGSLLGDLPVIDALSDYDFYQEGLVAIPIPANDHIEPFIANQVAPLWTYYCVAQNKLVSNRFF